MGGGIFLENSFLTESNNSYVNNSAHYGNNIATPGVNLLIAKKFDRTHPGQLIPNCIEVLIEDYFNQSVISETEPIVFLYLLNNTPNSSIEGNSYLISQDGSFNFCNEIIFGIPDSIVTLRVGLFNSVTDTKHSYQEFDFKLDFCYLGEITTEANNACIPCSNGTYTLYNNETRCNQCPANADCYMNIIIPHSGY